MRVISCPNCHAPLPGLADYCAICGEILIPSSTSTAIQSAGCPRAFNMPRFFAFRSDAEETMSFAELSSTSSETIKLAQKPQRSARDRAIPLAEIANDFLEDEEDEVIESSRPGGNWHKIVDSRPRTPSTSRTAIPALRRPLPLPPEHLPAATSPRPPFTSPRQWQPSLFFWISILVVFVALAGS